MRLCAFSPLWWYGNTMISCGGKCCGVRFQIFVQCWDVSGVSSSLLKVYEVVDSANDKLLRVSLKVYEVVDSANDKLLRV